MHPWLLMPLQAGQNEHGDAECPCCSGLNVMRLVGYIIDEISRGWDYHCINSEHGQTCCELILLFCS